MVTTIYRNDILKEYELLLEGGLSESSLFSIVNFERKSVLPQPLISCILLIWGDERFQP